MKMYIHSYQLVRFCQDAIITMRPTSQSICTGYLPFYGSRCEQRGATILRIWLPCAIQTCGTQALVVPLFYYGDANKCMATPQDNKKKISPWIYFLGIAFPIILILKGLEDFFPFITTEWFFVIAFLIFFIIIGRK